MQMSGGLKAIAGNAFGGMGSSQAREMAGIIQNKAYSFEGKTQNYDIENIQENVIGFAEAGGFDNATNSKDMKETLRGVVENTREFANTMKLAQEDAVKIMADLEKNMVAKTENMGSLGARIGGAADRLGVSSTDLAGFGMQGSEMLRGTGATSRQGFNMALEARMQTERLKYADPTTRQLINQAGGAGQFAMSQMETASTWTQSGQGMMATMGMLGGSDALPGNMTNMFQGAANFMGSDPLNFFRFQSRQGELSASLGVRNQQSMMVNTAHKMAGQFGLTGKNGEIDEDALVGIMQNVMGLQANQARGAIHGVRDSARNSQLDLASNEVLSEIKSQNLEGKTGIIDYIKGSVSYGVGEFFDSSGINDLAVGMSNHAKEARNAFGDFILGRDPINLGLSSSEAGRAFKAGQEETFAELINNSGEGRSISEIAKDRTEGVRSRSGAFGGSYQSLLNDGYSSDFLNRAVGGFESADQQEGVLGNLKIATLRHGREKIEDLTSLNLQEGEITAQDRKSADNIVWSDINQDSSLVAQRNQMAQMMLGDASATTQDLTGGQVSVMNSRIQNQNTREGNNFKTLDDDTKEVLKNISTSENSLTASSRIDGKKDALEDKQSKIMDNIDTDLIGTVKSRLPGDTTDEEAKAFIKWRAQNPNGTKEDFYDSDASRRTKTTSMGAQGAFTHYENDEMTDEGFQSVNLAIDDNKGIQKYRKAEDTLNYLNAQSKARADITETLGDRVDKLDPKIVDSLVESRANDLLRGVEKGERRFKLEDLNVSTAQIEELEKGLELEDTQKTVKTLASQITKGGMKKAMEDGNSQLFMQNYSKHLQNKVMEGFSNIVTSDGIKTLAPHNLNGTRKTTDDKMKEGMKDAVG